MKTLSDLYAEYRTKSPGRIVTLSDSREGLRTGLACEVKAVDGEPAMMDFIATDETLDRYGEVIKLDGWELGPYKANPVVVDSHNYYTIGNIIGRSEKVWVEKGQMWNRVKFALDNPLGALAHKLAVGGFIKSESVGFIPLEWVDGRKAGEPYRTFTKQELIEISLVAVPANPGATLGAGLKAGAIAPADVRAAADLLLSLCSDQATPPDDARSAVRGSDAEQKLYASLIRFADAFRTKH